MSAAEVLRAARAVGVSVTLEDDDLVLEAEREPPADVLDGLAQHKTAVLELLRRATCNRRAVFLRVAPGVPAEWGEGLAALHLADPLEGFTLASWRQLLNDAGRFVDRWGSEAARLGWTALDLFGVHQVAPAVRYDAMGLMPLIRGGEVVALDATRATIRMPAGGLLTYLRRQRHETVAVWDVACGR